MQITQCITSKSNFVRDVLGLIYRHELIHAQKVKSLGNQEYEVTFNFKPYERTNKEYDHISGNQINEAIFEAAFLSIAQSLVDCHFYLPVGLKWFFDFWEEWIVFNQNYQFRTMVRANTPVTLKCSFTSWAPIRLRKKYMSLEVKIDGFVRGTIQCIIPAMICDIAEYENQEDIERSHSALTVNGPSVDSF